MSWVWFRLKVRNDQLYMLTCQITFTLHFVMFQVFELVVRSNFVKCWLKKNKQTSQSVRFVYTERIFVALCFQCFFSSHVFNCWFKNERNKQTDFSENKKNTEKLDTSLICCNMIKTEPVCPICSVLHLHCKYFSHLIYRKSDYWFF